jgi:hypothetical protein
MVALVIVVALGLGGCGVLQSHPSNQIVARAVALQVIESQRQIAAEMQATSDPMHFPPAADDLNAALAEVGLAVRRVKIRHWQPLIIGDLTGFQVQGTYDLDMLGSDRPPRRHNPFEIYLQRQSEGKTWRLARPDWTAAATPGRSDEAMHQDRPDAQPHWTTYRLQ